MIAIEGADSMEALARGLGETLASEEREAEAQSDA